MMTKMGVQIASSLEGPGVPKNMVLQSTFWEIRASFL